MANYILFGGNFDPIHDGHIQMALTASKALKAKVIFIPAKTSIWKEASETTVLDKVKMITLATLKYPDFSIDLYEINQKAEQTYTIDTVTHFVSENYDDKFYLLIGGDQVRDFHKWHKAKTLSKLVKICYYERSGIKISSTNIRNFRMKKISGPMVDISSTDIRELKHIKMNAGVIDYILDNNLYFMKKITPYLDPNRLKHSISVAELAYEIALANNIKDPDRALIAGLLHDIGKNIEDKLSIMQKSFPKYVDMPEFSYHQFVSKVIASKDFGIKDKSILDAICFHATGRDDMDAIAKIVYAADKIDPTRGYDSKSMINAMMKDYEKGFIKVLKENKKYLTKSKKSIDNRLTSKCFKFYLGNN